MSFQERVQKYLDDFLIFRNDLFLIYFKLDKNYNIEIVIDGDNGIILQDCIDLNRHINESLQSCEEDFSINIFSAGVSSPLINKRQYLRNIGRVLQIKTKDKEYLAKLLAADPNTISITWKSREPKKIGNGKQTVINLKELKYEDIIESIVTITF
jgi:ribosome maturation factor RimP